MTTTRRGWRVALDSLSLHAVIACGSLSVLLLATPATAVAAGREMTVAAAGSRGAFVASPPGDVGDTVSQDTSAVAAGSFAPSESGGTFTGTSASIPRDSAEDDDDSDGDGLEHGPSSGWVRALETRLPHIEVKSSVSRESDGHSLRAPPR